MLFSVSMFPIGSVTICHTPSQKWSTRSAAHTDWDTVMPVIRRAYDRMVAEHDRVHVTITMDEHEGGTFRLDGAVDDVARELGHPVPV